MNTTAAAEQAPVPLLNPAAEAAYLVEQLAQAHANAAKWRGVAEAEHATRVDLEHRLAGLRDELAECDTLAALERELDVDGNASLIARSIADDLGLPTRHPDGVEAWA